MTCAISIMAVLFVGQPRDEGDSQGVDVQCGSYSLYVALRSLGIGPSSYEELERNLGVPDARGYSMLDLARAAQSFGATTIAVETNLDNLLSRREKFVCLTMIEDNHFVLLYSCDDEAVKICDAPRLVVVPRETFEGMWSRKALLIAREALQTEEVVDARRSWFRFQRIGQYVVAFVITLTLMSWVLARSRSRLYRVAVLLGYAVTVPFGLGCGGATDSSELGNTESGEMPSTPSLIAIDPMNDLGRILITLPNQVVQAKARLHNVGGRTVTIRQLIPSCACSSVTVDPVSISPGNSAVLRISVRLANNDADGVARVRVLTDDRSYPVTEISFKWSARNILHTDTPSLDLDQLRVNQEINREIPIMSRGLSPCPSCEFYISDSLSELRCQFRPVAGSLAEGHAPSVSDSDLLIGHLSLEISPSEEPGHRQGDIHLAVQCGGRDLALLNLPIAWRVEPKISVYPERLYLGVTGPGDHVTRSLVVSSKAEGQFRLFAIEHSGHGSLVSQEFDQESAMMHEVKLEIAAPRSEGGWSAQLHLITDDEEVPRVAVPVAGLVEAAQAE